MENKFFKKTDIILAVIILALGLGGLLLLRAPSKESSRVEIRVNGVLFDSLKLSENTEFDVSTSRGHNTIQIKDGQVSVVSADCTGQDCVHMGKISKEGEILLCLPHKLSVQIVGSAEDKLDAVSY